MAYEVLMPQLGLTMEEGTVSSWVKHEGDAVKAGDVLLEITTDKLTNEVTSEHDGVLLKIVAQEGEDIPVKGLLGYVGEAGEVVGDAAVTKQFPLTVQNKKGRIALADVHFGVEPTFSRTTAAHHQSVEVAAVFPAIQPHADVLSKNAVFERVLVPVFLIHGPRIAPFGGTVFFASSVIAPGRKINANAQPIGGNKNEDSFYTVLTPHDFEWIVHCRRQGVYDLRKSPGNGRRNQQGEPDHRDQPQGIEPGAARLVIWLHPGASLSCLFGLGRQWFSAERPPPGRGRAVPLAYRCAVR